MADSMKFDPARGAGMARTVTRIAQSQRPGQSRPHTESSHDSEHADDGEKRSHKPATTDAQSPESVFAEAVSAPVAASEQTRETVAAPGGNRPTSEAIAKAARAHEEAVSRSGGEVEARVAASVETARKKDGASDAVRSLRISGAVTEAVRAEFPEATSYTKAIEAFVALHTGRPDLAPKALRDEVERRLAENDAGGAQTAAVRSLARAVSELKYDVAVSSMASVALLSHWYDEELGRSGVPMSEWLGLSDGIFEVSGELSSLSAEYHEALRRSHGRRPKGFGRG